MENDSPPPPPEREEIDHVAYGRELVECLRCNWPNALDPARPAQEQRCTSCGHRLAKRKKKRRWYSWFAGSVEQDGGEPPKRLQVLGPSKERIWFLFAGPTLVAVIASIFLLWMMLKPDPVESKAGPLTLPVETQIQNLVARFAAAQTSEDLLSLIRDPEKNTEALLAWCTRQENRLPLEGELIQTSPVRSSLGHEILTATAKLGRSPGMQLLCVNTPDGWRIDWRAFTQAGDMTAAAFLEKKPAQPALLYLVVQQSTYYNGPYADEKQWLSLRVTDSRGEAPFFAAVPRSDAALTAALGDLPPPVDREGVNLALYGRRRILRLRFTHPELSPPVAEVTAVEGDGWFIP